MTAERLDLPDADVTLHRDFFPRAAADALLESLQRSIAWEQQHITLFGKSIPMPRLTAWYGDPGASYTYSRRTFEPRPWTAELLAIKRAVELASETAFNSVLLNLYRGERESMAWHADDEPELGMNPLIASVSLGAARRFQLRHNVTRAVRTIELSHGSLLVMAGPTQHHWKHRVPKETRPHGPRVNLTFRVIRRLSEPEA
ncbi:MAG: alpha-ketoglutarate-dependent dioxygenase AlkB [Gemmataceae bacterium]